MAMNQGEFDAWKLDREYRSQDDLRIYNPTQDPFTLIWDGFKRWTVNAQQELTVKRFEAEKYARDMSVKIINNQNDEMVSVMKQERTAKGFPQLTKDQENEEMRVRAKKTNDEGLVADLYNQLVLGVVKKYQPIRADDSMERVPDTKTLEERLVETMDRPYVIGDLALHPEPVVQTPSAVKGKK